MGQCAAPDAYIKRFGNAIMNIDRKYKCVDNTVLYDVSVEDAFWHTHEFLETCTRAGITVKPEKFKFCRREVEFVGYHLGWDIYKPTDDRLSAVRNFAIPDHLSIIDIRSWCGLVNQLAPFLVTAPVMELFRDLLKKPLGRKVYGDDQL